VPADILPVEQDLAGLRAQQAGNGLQQGGLAGAVGPMMVTISPATRGSTPGARP